MNFKSDHKDNILVNLQQDKNINCQKLFGFNVDFALSGFKHNKYVPDIDEHYQFDPKITKAILASFMFNKKTILQGLHGTGKSTHIEQIAARLNWPLIRINLDGHITRSDLIGRDVIKIKDGKQITEFQAGILPFAFNNPIALVLDEYDAGRPDVMFVIQRILEENGKLTMLDQNLILTAHKYFRIFATCNTLGRGEVNSGYYGTNPINHGQLDRWQIIINLNYLDPQMEYNIIANKVPDLLVKYDKQTLKQMIKLAELVRNQCKADKLSLTISPRTAINWAQNILIFNDIILAFKYAYLNKCEEEDFPLINELYQRVFGEYIFENIAQ